jgi:hypothetical protein
MKIAAGILSEAGARDCRQRETVAPQIVYSLTFHLGADMSAGGVKEVAGHPAQFPALLTQWCGSFDAPPKTRTQKWPKKAQTQTATQLLIE